MKVSVIMPFVNEWPQIAFTIRAVKEQLEGYCDYEIIAVDNYCQEVANQGQKPDRGHDHFVLNKQNLGLYNIPEEKRTKAAFQIGHIMAQSRVNGKWLKCYKFDSKLSHWNAKNLGVSKSTGDTLLFLDSHVVPSNGLLKNALNEFYIMYQENGHLQTMHLPLSYHILENKRLMYKLVYEPNNGVVHYSFTGMPIVKEVIEVPCMSTCGMIMRRSLFDKLNGWPDGLGIYGGGEHYMNFTCAILGVKKYVYPYGCLHHHGDRRNYSWNWTDYHRNRMIATGIFGGTKMLEKYEKALGGNNGTKTMMQQALMAIELHCQKMDCSGPFLDINQWVKEWEGHRAIGYNTGNHYV